MKQYHDLLKDILENGTKKGDRTGTGTISLFGPQMSFDLSKGFPLVTTKKVFWRGVVEELLWMLRGETNVKSLQAKGVKIWDEWADPNGELGPVYGQQWRSWTAVRSVRSEVPGEATEWDEEHFHIDQIAEVVQRITEKPDDRRLIVTAWNPADISRMKLPPCHCFFQFYVSNGELSCKLYQRSADMFLGVPFNIASYALLTHIIAHQTNLKPGRFVHTFGDAHIYLNHIDQVREQLSREPRPLPTLRIDDCGQTDPESYEFEDFKLDGYDPHPAIKGEVSV